MYDNLKCDDDRYLNSGLWQVDLECHLLPHEDVRVPGLLEQGLQYVQLGPRKGRPLTSLFPNTWRFSSQQIIIYGNTFTVLTVSAQFASI
jgi:hypothetical protein